MYHRSIVLTVSWSHGFILIVEKMSVLSDSP